MKKVKRTHVTTVSDAVIIQIIRDFTVLYNYAPDKLDIALRCGYRPRAMQDRLYRMERRGLVKRQLGDKTGYGNAGTWQVVEGV